MKQLIACCGIDCENCDARISTVTNDNGLREKTAQKWRVQYNTPQITAESINCLGCRTDGVKIGHCDDCEIRNCVKIKDYNTCGECKELYFCKTNFIVQHVPDAKENLKT